MFQPSFYELGGHDSHGRAEISTKRVQIQTVEPDAEPREYVLAAGEKRSRGASEQPPAKRGGGGASERQPAATTNDPQMRRKVVAAHEPLEEDHLRGLSNMQIVQVRSGQQSIIHQCTYSAATDPDKTCACCFGGCARDIAHVRDPHSERRDGVWHCDVVGPSAPGVGIDSSKTFVMASSRRFVPWTRTET